MYEFLIENDELSGIKLWNLCDLVYFENKLYDYDIFCLCLYREYWFIKSYVRKEFVFVVLKSYNLRYILISEWEYYFGNYISCVLVLDLWN